jgi:hypothetical protein
MDDLKKIKIFEKEYDVNNLPQEIVLECGCVQRKDDCECGISYSTIKLCEEHTPKIDLEKEKQHRIDIIQNQTRNILSKNDYKELPSFREDLTDEEYNNLLNARQSIRQASRARQAQIQEATTIEELNNINYFLNLNKN